MEFQRKLKSYVTKKNALGEPGEARISKKNWLSGPMRWFHGVADTLRAVSR